LVCAYCGSDAETWDHVHATVRDKKFSGYGHRLGNLLPCCKLCNSKKGNKDWRAFLAGVSASDTERKEREDRIDAYLYRYSANDVIPDHLPEYRELQDIRQQVLTLLGEADRLANIVRSKNNAV
jgi:hypothetical protein